MHACACQPSKDGGNGGLGLDAPGMMSVPSDSNTRDGIGKERQVPPRSSPKSPRPITRRAAVTAFVAPAPLLFAQMSAAPHEVERWGMYEIALGGPQTDSAFVDVHLTGEFRFHHRVIEVSGFYDGAGVYRIRFMPDEIGDWQYTTKSSSPELSGETGRFTCVSPSAKNHGPVRVEHQYHFAYADGTPYKQVGTTSYAWTHQGDAQEELTLATLKTSPFNKIRMCVFPKHYTYNNNEPPEYAFEKGASGKNDLARFNPKFFQRFERRIVDLMALGIEADVIIFHPYDRWGYSSMPADADDRYLRYLVARISAYRNVWWSLANEFDFMKSKTMADWDRFFRIVQETDPYQHLRSVHNGRLWYDHAKPWVTHASVQSSDVHKTAEWASRYGKPVVIDECKYEGNIPQSWGAISAQELVRRFWLGTVGGGYVGHGETYLDPNDDLWWSKGGVLKGESPKRIAFLRRIVEEGPTDGLYADQNGDYKSAANKSKDYYLFYFDLYRPGRYEFKLDPGGEYRAEIIDTWDMTITAAPGTYGSTFKLALPAKPYIAVRIRKAS